MRTLFRFTLWSLFALVVLVALLGVVWYAMGMPHDGVLLTIDGDSITLPADSAGNWVLAIGGLLVALLVVAVVVPLALLLGVGLPALLVAAGLVVGFLVLGLTLTAVASPVLLPVLVVWWLMRRDAKARAAAASSTIAG